MYVLVIVCGCETWSLTLQEESRLWGFENVARRKLFGLKGEAVKRSSRKLHIMSEKDHRDCDTGGEVGILDSIQINVGV